MKYIVQNLYTILLIVTFYISVIVVCSVFYEDPQDACKPLQVQHD